MAISASGLYVPTFLDVFDATQEPINLVGDTIKTALVTNSSTPNFSSDTVWGTGNYQAPPTGTEVSGTGYTTGGFTETTKTFVETSPAGGLKFDADDAVWGPSPAATFSGARGAVLWDDTPAAPAVADPLVCLVNFTADYGVTSGTFTVQWSSSGIFAIDITP